MKILLLRIENIKKIKVLEVKPDGTMNLVTGKNDQGKSTLIDSISYLFEGKKVLPEKLLREGTEKGFILAETENYVIKRVVTTKDSYLSVESKDGAQFKSPQQLLDKLVGDISFDVMDFAKKNDKEQLQIITRLTGINHQEKNQEIIKLREQAQDLRKDLAQCKARLANKEYDPGLPPGETSYIELQAELDQVAADKKEREDKEENIAEMKDENTSLENEIRNIKQRIVELNTLIVEKKKQIEENNANIEHDQANLEMMPIVSDEEIRKKIADLEINNRKIRENNDVQANLIVKTDLEDDLRIVSEKIEAIEMEKQKEISEAKLPIEGLSFNDEGVLYNGLPFNEKQQSRSNILKVSLAIGMQLNPQLKVLTSKSGNELDEDNLKLVAEMIKDKDYQLWMEKVDSSGMVGIHIEDGGIVSIDGQKCEKQEKIEVEEKNQQPELLTTEQVTTAIEKIEEENPLL